MELRFLVAPLALCAGCTIIFDADDLRHRDANPAPDAGPDAAMPDAIPIDADPSLLDVTGSEPDELDEGIGGEGGRPALIKILGDSIAPDAVITAAFVEASLAQPVVVETGVAPSQTSAVVSIQIPVLSDLAAGATRTLQITVSQNAGATVDTVDLIVNGLDELTLAGGNVAVTTLAEKYSHIDVTGNTHFTGATPVRLVATGDIAIAAILDADGTGATGGVQGCAGGASATDGPCDGGKKGANASLGNGAGGGGGGFGAIGTDGTDQNATVLGGAGGGTSGNDMLMPFVTAGAGAGNRGAGGGGGGNGTVGLGAGAAGGGGGGVILVQAGGDIDVTGTGAIRSKGGDGLAPAGSGGGGGGGAGGAILVRAGGAITSVAWLSSPGGGGGPATNSGGAGGVGRIRVDAPAGDVPAMSTTPAATRGPAWDDEVPVIVRMPNPGLQIRGPSGRLLGVTVDGESVGDFTIGTNGTKTLDDGDFELELGVHELCVAYAAFATSPDTSTPESLSCVTVAYYP